MPAIPTPVDVLQRVQRDVERNLLRARNGIRHVAGVDRTRVGQTPKDTVWSRDRCTLWRYRSDGVRHAPPILIVMSLISRSYILDLRPGNSFVERLRDAGYDVFLLDWGVPDEVDAGNDFATYVDGYLPEAVARTRAAAGSDGVTVLGYCFGGVLALLLAAAHPELPIRNLVCMATPVDFSRMGSLVALMRAGRLEVDDVVDDSGNIPGDVVRNAFRLRRPTGEVVEYANLWENLWNDRYLEGYQAMAQWTRDHIPLPGAVARETVELLARGNALMSGEMTVGHRRVHLRDVRVPLLHVLALRDDIVPRAAAEPLLSLVGTERPEELRLDAGHVGLIMGRQASTTTMPVILEWLERHSLPATAEAPPRRSGRRPAGATARHRSTGRTR